MPTVTVLPDKHEKASYVKRMFAAISPSYDAANEAMTFGLDQRWRQQVVEAIAPTFNSRVLDIGTGTGDFLPLLAPWLPQGIAVGVDFCLPMMQQGWAKLDTVANLRTHLTSASMVNGVTDMIPPGVVSFVGGDALCLPFPDNTFDIITTGFTMRNVTDIEATFREMWRVSKVGGTLACLEVARPTNRLLRLGHWLYFQHIVPWIGGTMSGSHESYTYLPRSALAFPPPDRLAQIVQQAGWHSVTYKLLELGAAALHQGVKL